MFLKRNNNSQTQLLEKCLIWKKKLYHCHLSNNPLNSYDHLL